MGVLPELTNALGSLVENRCNDYGKYNRGNYKNIINDL